ncbi:MAG TPA: hypothetical protein VJL10_02720 [Anaerolineales bacterium]|nr:hypothetical protein [Anaerolineales bacterium]
MKCGWSWNAASDDQNSGANIAFDPRTPLESAARFIKLNPNLRILSIEIDKGRVDAAETLAQKGYKINLQKKFLAREYLIWEQ